MDGKDKKKVTLTSRQTEAGCRTRRADRRQENKDHSFRLGARTEGDRVVASRKSHAHEGLGYYAFFFLPRFYLFMLTERERERTSKGHAEGEGTEDLKGAPC